ncbi:MAG TPA: hypothetical protein VF813_02335 [Anaerolineaceae bacterium]
MDSPFAKQSRWRAWARFLQQHGLAGFTASLIESAGPLALIGAQALYLGQPLVGRPGQEDGIRDLAEMLEDRDERRRFAAFLREETTL